MVEAGYQAHINSGELPKIFLDMLAKHEHGKEALAILEGKACAAYPGTPTAWKLKPEDL